eukprot:Tbor_TRINITY_DN5572_c0_g1::TRINITY_DN5572_c0_g1_i1::g.13699::m.13699
MSNTSLLTLLAFIFQVTAYLVTLSDGKGSYTSGRGSYSTPGSSYSTSSGVSNRPRTGGSYRPYSSYSRAYTYLPLLMLWGHSSRYNHYNRDVENDGYNGPENRIGSSDSNSEYNDILCRRRVLPIGELDVDVPFITHNSTKYCVRMGSSSGEIETLMLDRFVFTYDVETYPTLKMTVYPDKDIVVPDMMASLRFTNLFITSSKESRTPDSESIDLSTVNWRPCLKTVCDEKSSRTFGPPSSQFMDNSRVETSAITATVKGRFDITIRFWISNDFIQDPEKDILLLPSLVKIDFTIKATNESIKTSEYMHKYFGLEAIVVTTKTGPGSQANVMVPSGEIGLEQNPFMMSRVQFGTVQDVENRYASILAWSSSTDESSPCSDPQTSSKDPNCVTFLQENGVNDIVCDPKDTKQSANNAGAEEVCTGLVESGQVGRKLEWVFPQSIAYSMQSQFYMHFGFNDPGAKLVDYEAVPSGTAFSSSSIFGSVLLLITLLISIKYS